MTREEAIHKLEYSKKAYQTLIDEKVDSGKLVGDGVRGEWKAETPLDEVYKSMIEALDMAIKALEQQPTRPTGRWIEKEDYNLDTYYECSECGADYCIEGDILIHKYCPNCGARMTELKEMEVEDDQQGMD